VGGVAAVRERSDSFSHDGAGLAQMTPPLRYATVLAAMMAAYEIGPKHAAAFNARLGNLQRWGVYGRGPGRGIALDYRADKFHRLIFACEMMEFGIKPNLLVPLLQQDWNKPLRHIFDEAAALAALRDQNDDDIVLCMTIDALTKIKPVISSCRLGDLQNHVSARMQRSPSLHITNLSALLRRFYRAIPKGHRMKHPIPDAERENGVRSLCVTRDK
jgi:hypothetical protein